MLQLRVYASSEQVDAVCEGLDALDGVRHLLVTGNTHDGMTQLTAEIEPAAADVVLDALRGLGFAAENVTLWRATSIQPLAWRRKTAVPGGDRAIWAEVTGRAFQHARPGLIYLLYMAAAGVIAGVGVLNGSSILVVGAMALSPDLLPISAAAVGIVERRWRLAGRAAATLAVGLAMTTLASAATTLVLRATGRIDPDLQLAESLLGPSLTEVGPGTVLVAMAAGMAGMLAYETAGSAAVGVAISVTTIPAAAYLGDAIGMASRQNGLGALAVLATNVASIVVASTVTLGVQRLRPAGPTPR